MAGTLVEPKILAPLPTSAGGMIPGDAATGLVQREVDKFFRRLEPRKTEFLNKIKKVSAVNQPLIEWGQSFYRPLDTTLAAQQGSSDTTMTVASGAGKLFQKYMVMRVIDSTNGDEVEWLYGDPPASGDVISNIARHQGTTSAVVHASGLAVEIIGTAEPYGVDHVVSPVQYGTLVTNRFQRFAGSISLDKAADRTPNWESMSGSQKAELVRLEAINQKYLLQKAVLYGSKQAPDQTTSPKTPGLMGGWREYITTHSTNLNNSTVSIWDIDDLASATWEDVTDNTATVLAMSNSTKRALARRTVPVRDLSGAANKQNTLDFRLNSVMLDSVGEINFMVVPDFPEGEIWGVNFDMLELVPYAGLDWHFNDLPTAGEYEWEAFTGDFSLRVKGEKSQFRLYGINTNLALYPKGAW